MIVSSVYSFEQAFVTSTSSKTVSTNKSSSELRQPTITPVDEDRGRSYGQNTRSKPSLMIMLSSSTRRLEGASTAQLFPGGDAEIHVARMLKNMNIVSECYIYDKNADIDVRLRSFGSSPIDPLSQLGG
jgi:hypothetical protein